METKVLVAYASSYGSTHGSTQEIAEVISETLRSQGLAVDIQPIRKVRILEGYSAVVLGAPLYMFHWHKDARHFLSQHRKILTDHLPVQFSPVAPLAKETGKNGRKYEHYSIGNWRSFPGLLRSLFISLAESSTRRSCASPIISFPFSRRCRQVTYGIGWRFAPGQTAWPRNFC